MAAPLPTIHLNGSSSTSLLITTRDALRAVNAAIDAVTAAAPNARDYYPQGPEAWSAADKAQRDRLAKLIDVRDELAELFRGISDMVSERAGYVPR